MINFQFSVIRYRLEALNEFEVPYFLGSTFRGIMGRRLRKIVCIKPAEDCRVCEFKMTCPYTVVFDTEAVLNKPSKYIFRPPYTRKKIKEGESITFDITLLGESSNYWEFISECFSGVLNIGKDRYLKMRGIEYLHPFENRFYPVKSFVPRFEAVSFFEMITGEDRIKVRLFPTSIKIKSEIIRYDQFDKDRFLKAVVSRVSNVAVNYGVKNEKIFIDKSGFEIKQVELKPSPMKRWSNRKKRKMVIPAFEGSFVIEGNLKEIYPYLLILEVINIGKSVSFGLGRLQLLSSGEPSS
ncbi:CRISPR system precrRNA processing endoribonuclease RAMP protein Cas6 [Persephonella sp.]